MPLFLTSLHPTAGLDCSYFQNAVTLQSKMVFWPPLPPLSCYSLTLASLTIRLTHPGSLVFPSQQCTLTNMFTLKGGKTKPSIKHNKKQAWHQILEQSVPWFLGAVPNTVSAAVLTRISSFQPKSFIK